MCPPLAALILLWKELTKALTVRIGMLFHSSINAFLSCARVAGRFQRFLTLLSSSSHMCSIGVKSGLCCGHASGAMLLFARKSWQTRATCGRALSCCRIRLRCCTSRTATEYYQKFALLSVRGNKIPNLVFRENTKKKKKNHEKAVLHLPPPIINQKIHDTLSYVGHDHKIW